MMRNFDLVRYHVQSSIRAAIAESNGYEEEADRLRAQGYLRLMVMSEEELHELARVLSHPSSKAPEIVYDELKQMIADQAKASPEWIGKFGVVPFPATTI